MSEDQWEDEDTDRLLSQAFDKLEAYTGRKSFMLPEIISSACAVMLAHGVALEIFDENEAHDVECIRIMYESNEKLIESYISEQSDFFITRNGKVSRIRAAGAS
jgi:hypothetical protein